uniref:homeobox and leucine zipper encoding b n=1 Tax=Gasterosteus aculeatus aculeatus TaxID=481459 RepID=UPI001A980F63|nr:homeobox and leucine zipper encoding b [Gasterosteus aculeatus aculeatus]
MSQKADGGLPRLGQNTPNAPGKTLSEANAAFSGNQCSVVCLPLVSDSQKLIWVPSNQINLQLDGEAKLNEAFDQFPYLTQKRTAELAQHCSLHPDQVKVWFIAQRLRYGISWDAEDIPNVRKELTSGLGKDEVQNGEGTEHGGKVPEERSARDGRMVEENGRAAERLDMKLEQLAEKPKDRKEGDKRNNPKKRKRMTVTNNMGKKSVKHEGEGVGERAEGEETRIEGADETTHFAKKKEAKSNQTLAPVQGWPSRHSLQGPNDLLDASPQTPAVHVPPVTCVHRGPLKLEMETQTDLDRDGRAAPAHVRFRTKSRAQLKMMQAAFSQCQYPNVEDYSRLSEAIDMPRYVLVQWFGDMRYYIKKFHPRWLSDEQYARALATIRDQQNMRSLEKI